MDGGKDAVTNKDVNAASVATATRTVGTRATRHAAAAVPVQTSSAVAASPAPSSVTAAAAAVSVVQTAVEAEHLPAVGTISNRRGRGRETAATEATSARNNVSLAVTQTTAAVGETAVVGRRQGRSAAVPEGGVAAALAETAPAPVTSAAAQTQKSTRSHLHHQDPISAPSPPSHASTRSAGAGRLCGKAAEPVSGFAAAVVAVTFVAEGVAVVGSKRVTRQAAAVEPEEVAAGQATSKRRRT